MTGFRRMKVRAQELSIVAITWNQTTTRGMWRQTDLVEMAFGFRLYRKISHHLIILLPIALPLALHDVMCRCTQHAYIFLSFSFPLCRLRRALLLLLLHNPSKWEKVAEPVSFLFSPFIRRPLGLVSWSECVLCVRFFLLFISFLQLATASMFCVLFSSYAAMRDGAKLTHWHTCATHRTLNSSSIAVPCGIWCFNTRFMCLCACGVSFCHLNNSRYKQTSCPGYEWKQRHSLFFFLD